MQEVWRELMSGVSIKALFITLLSITIFLSCSLYFFYSSTGFAPQREEFKQSEDIAITNDQIISTQTNFTQ